mgnify:CR=1 FL=1
MAQDLASTVREQLSGMGRVERQRAIESLRSVMLDAMHQTERESADYEVRCCPRCGCVEMVRKGHAKDGSQRCLCHGCARTFGVRTGRVAGMGKLPAEKWMACVQCFVDRLGLRACAERAGVSLPTGLFMRRRLLEVVAAFVGTFSAAEGCGCELDGTYFPESFKGDRMRGSFELPRRAHHRGRQRRRRGLSKERICVMSGVNDSGEPFLDMAGRGSLSSRRALDCPRGRIQDGAVVATDRSGAYPSALRELSAAAHHACGSRDRSEGAISHVDALRSALDGFMARCRGVPTRHLAECLAWFRWDCSFSVSSLGAGAPVRQMESCACHASLGDRWGAEPPCMECWARQVAWHAM